MVFIKVVALRDLKYNGKKYYKNQEFDMVTDDLTVYEGFVEKVSQQNARNKKH